MATIKISFGGTITQSTQTPNYFYAEAIEDTSIMFYNNGVTGTLPALKYRVGSTGEFTNYTIGNTISLTAGQKCYWQAQSSNATFSEAPELSGIPVLHSIILISTSGNINVGGNIMSLANSNFTSLLTIPSDNYFAGLFATNTKLISAANLLLPATTLTEACYQGMFYGCSNLTTPPTNLPASTLAISCYSMMFIQSGVTSVPTISAITAANSACLMMYLGCSGITTIPSTLLSSVATLDTACFKQMFSNCVNLSNACALPVTTLADSCYWGMFASTAIETPPTLAATSLATACYKEMFMSSNILTLPSHYLPATTLATDCYYEMFATCDALETPCALPATTLAAGCYNSMFKGCSLLTFVPRLPATNMEDVHGNDLGAYVSMFNGCEALYVADSSTEATYDWKIPDAGTFTNTNQCEQGDMFGTCLGTRASGDTLICINGEQKTFYTQNVPISW